MSLDTVSPLSSIGPFREVTQEAPSDRLSGISIFWGGEPLLPAQRSELLDFLKALPSFLDLIAVRQTLVIVNLGNAEFAKRFPGSSLKRQTFFLEPGIIYLRDAGRFPNPRLSLLFKLEELQYKTRYVRAAAPRAAITWIDNFLIPTDSRFPLEPVLNQMAHQGIRFQPTEILQMEMGLSQTVGDRGKSVHQFRLRATNPALNRALYRSILDPLVLFDPNLQIYSGLFATGTTDPAGLRGTAALGADVALMVFRGGYRLMVDSNIQSNVRSSRSIPGDELALEVIPRLESKDRRLALGFSVAANIEAEFRGAIVGKFRF